MCIINYNRGGVELSIENLWVQLQIVVVVQTLRKVDYGVEYCWSFVLVQMVEEDGEGKFGNYFLAFVKELRVRIYQ